MGEQWMQFVAAGLTSGAIYALVALGFSIVYNASHAINFAQGEFVMVGGMAAVSLAVSYTHLRAHETVLDLVCRLLLEKKK